MNIKSKCRLCNNEFECDYKRLTRRTLYKGDITVCPKCSQFEARSIGNSRPKSETHRAKIGASNSKALTGRSLTPEHRKNISEGMKLIAPQYTMTDDVRGKISDSITKRWLDGTFSKIPNTGAYDSGICDVRKCLGKTKVHYRSSYEKKFISMLELDDNVVEYQYEPLRISYQSFGKEKCYIPDFLIKLRDSEELILCEVKPSKFVGTQENQDKFSAARKIHKFIVVTEKELGL